MSEIPKYPPMDNWPLGVNHYCVIINCEDPNSPKENLAPVYTGASLDWLNSMKLVAIFHS